MTSVGLVGTGFWAETIHGPTIASHAGLTGRAIWGRDASARDRLAEKLGLVAFETFEEMVASVDVVDFAVPPAAQVGLAVHAAEAGRHLLLEKPVAITVPEARRLDAAVVRARVAAVVFLTRLFDTVRGPWLEEQSRAGHRYGRVRWISAALAEGSPYARSAWRREGGALWDVGPHIVSQLVAVLGPVVGVTVYAHDPVGLSRVSLRHRGGASSDVEMTLHADPADKEESFEFEGPGGRATVPGQPLDFPACHARALAMLLQQAGNGPLPGEAPTSTRAAVEMTRVLSLIEGLFQSGPLGVYASLAAAT